MIHTRQSGTLIEEEIPSIESVLAGLQFRTEDGEIDFAAMRAASLISAEQLSELHESLFKPVKRGNNGEAGQSEEGK